MTPSQRHQVIQRLSAYLQASGVRLTQARHERVERIVDSVLAEGPGEAEERALASLSHWLAPASRQIPMQRPALMRGSIGYWPHA